MAGVQYSRWLPDLFGGICLTASETGLRSVQFGTGETHESNAILDAAEEQLREYFARERSEFNVPLEPAGTPFQLEVWKALLAIPYGETRSYRDIAVAVGRPQGFQAIGQANTANPLAVVIPCHRVINHDGSLGGYGGGLERKRELLALEKRYALGF